MEIELSAIWSALRKWFWVPLVLMIALGGIAYGIAERQDNVYTATATLVIELSASGSTNSSVSGITNQISDSYTLLLETEDFTNQIATQAGLPTVEDFDIRIVSPAGSGYLNIEATHIDSEAALNVANATVDVIIVDYVAKSDSRINETILAVSGETDTLYAERDAMAQELDEIEASGDTTSARHQQLVGEMRRLDQRIDDAEARVDRMRLDFQLSEPRFVPIKFSTPPSVPDNVRPELVAMLGVFLGGLLGAGLIVLRAVTNNTIGNSSDWQRHSTVPVLSEIPHAGALGEGGKNIFILSEPTAAPAEGVRMLVTGLDFAGFPEENKKVLQVTSPGPSDGKSTLSANLAVHYAQLGKRVLLVDCDLHRPRLHAMFSVPRENGLSNLLMNRNASLHEVASRVALPGLTLLPSGPQIPNPAEMFSSVHFEKALRHFKENFDVVILDTPPILLFSDTRRIASRSNAIIAVGRLERTKIQDMNQALETIQTTGTDLFGTVWVGSKPSKNHYYYRDKRRR